MAGVEPIVYLGARRSPAPYKVLHACVYRLKNISASATSVTSGVPMAQSWPLFFLFLLITDAVNLQSDLDSLQEWEKVFQVPTFLSVLF